MIRMTLVDPLIFTFTVQSSYQALPGNSMQARLRLAEMHP
jgi:hypothetical protein